MKSKGFTMLLIVLVIGLAIGLLAYLHKAEEEKTSDNASSILEKSYKDVSRMGEQNAPVHIVEFGDYKCPYCKKFHEEFVPFIAKEYVQSGKVQFHFINYSFIGTDSVYMAEFGETVRRELGESAFWRFHDLVYLNQQNESDIWGTEENMTKLLESFASKEEVGKVLKAVKEKKYEHDIELQNQIAKNTKVQGTPSVFIDGKQVSFRNYEELHKQIEDAVNGKK